MMGELQPHSQEFLAATSEANNPIETFHKITDYYQRINEDYERSFITDFGNEFEGQCNQLIIETGSFPAVFAHDRLDVEEGIDSLLVLPSGRPLALDESFSVDLRRQHEKLIKMQAPEHTIKGLERLGKIPVVVLGFDQKSRQKIDNYTAVPTVPKEAKLFILDTIINAVTIKRGLQLETVNLAIKKQTQAFYDGYINELQGLRKSLLQKEGETSS